MHREIKIIKEIIEKYQYDFTGLNIITELASGAYIYNCLIPLLSGANSVVAICKDSKYGKIEDIKKEFKYICEVNKIDTKILKIVDNIEKYICKADIITNSGFVRPISNEVISKMKKTAVIPLMWETWEFRNSDLNLESALLNDVLVLGTDESSTGIDMHPYAGMLGISILLDMNLEVYKNKVILLGKGLIGNAIAKIFLKLGVEVKWFVQDKENDIQEEYSNIYEDIEVFKNADAIIFAEHETPINLFENKSKINYNNLYSINPELKIGVIAGKIDLKLLKESKLFYYPKDIRQFGYLSYQTFNLGPRPILELFGAGLKVGEVMARCRKEKFDLEETIDYTLKHAPAMDFITKNYMDKYKYLKELKNE